MKNKIKSHIPKNLKAERGNVITHFIGAILAVIATILLIKNALTRPSWAVWFSYLIYGLSLIFSFSVSALYHHHKFNKWGHIFQKWDHSSIYILIAGSYTPYLLLTFQARWSKIFLILIWTLAIAGIFFENFYMNRFPRLSRYMYLGLGWLALFIVYPLITTLPFLAVVFLFLGGLSYSIGTLFYRQKDKPWMHVIWHLFVMGGAFFIFLSIYLYV